MQVSLTDADARLMKSKNGFAVVYNPQTAVDSETHLIRDFNMTNQVTDHGQLMPTMKGIREESENEILDSDDYLIPNALELVDKYIETIEDNNQFAGVVGLRGKADGSAWTSYYGTSTREKGLQELQKEYIDATSFEYRYKYGIQGDRAEVVRTEIIKSHPFPVFENERFITEGVVWSKLSVEGYKFRWFNSIIYITEYRDDGLTKNIGNAYL